MQQIIKESKVKFLSYPEGSPFATHEKTAYKNLLISNSTILTNPVDYQSGTIILDINNNSFISLSDELSFIELYADELIFIRINNNFILKTKNFSYLNENEKISLEVANGFQTINPNGSFTKLSTIQDIKLEYVTISDII